MLVWLQKYFGLHRREKKGITVLLLLISAVWLYPVVYNWINKPDLSRYQKILAAQSPIKPDTVKQERTTYAKEKAEIKYFYFNPNHLPTEQWRRLGLSERQISNIVHYEAKGGSFKRPEDLKKIYSLDEETYLGLKPYIRIPADLRSKAPKSRGISQYKKKQPPAIPQMDLNKADSLTLMQLPGIGPVFASRMVRYRNLLGGFYQISQLLEVYGMDSLRYQKIIPFLSLNKEDIVQIPINHADFQQLKRHPYIRSKYANILIQYRKQHGAFSAIDDLAQIRIFDAVYLHKIEPYLTFDP